jgi:hypothetical protein
MNEGPFSPIAAGKRTGCSSPIIPKRGLSASQDVVDCLPGLGGFDDLLR